MPSRFGTERTLAASHHEINQVVVTSPIDYILNKNDLFVMVPKSDTCLRLVWITPMAVNFGIVGVHQETPDFPLNSGSYSWYP
jgi:hypothetical protein